MVNCFFWFVKESLNNILKIPEVAIWIDFEKFENCRYILFEIELNSDVNRLTLKICTIKLLLNVRI